MTIVDAFGDLRPRNRAQRCDWYYRYGFHTNDHDGADLEPDPGGNPIGRRWTMKDSLAVIKVKGKVLKFVAWIDHPDTDVRPGARRESGRIRSWSTKAICAATPLFLDIPATPGKTHMVIETAIDRTVAPERSRQPRYARARTVDPRLGLAIVDADYSCRRSFPGRRGWCRRCAAAATPRRRGR